MVEATDSIVEDLIVPTMLGKLEDSEETLPVISGAIALLDVMIPPAVCERLSGGALA